MRVVNNGNQFHVYNNAVQLFNGLPKGVYQVEFDEMQGYSLSQHEDMEINEKVYGVHNEKVDKVLKSFEQFKRSLGVILSGDKGIGKSLFAKLLCIKAMEKDLPVIIVNGFTPGIAQFLDSMDQEMLVLFDEFDKTFKSNDKVDTQAQMLSLFDGVSMNKKLFCVTCNSLSGLNDFLVNRPGRFHYHFRFEYPDQSQIEQYLTDHLPKEKHAEIKKVIDFAKKVQLNYDCLRAIAFELSINDTFEEAISDLNILRDQYGAKTNLYLCFADGSRIKEEEVYIDMFDDDEYDIDFGDTSEAHRDYLNVKFTPTDAVWSEQHGGYYIPTKKLNVTREEYWMREESDMMKRHKEYVMAHQPEHVTGIVLRRIFDRNTIHYFKG